MTRPMDKMDRTTFLYNVPPSLIEHLCKIIDSGDDQFGWRGLAARIVPSWLEVRRAERLEAAGRSPARELLWTWAQQNPTVADLVRVLEDMGHHWALQLFVQPGESLYYDQCRRPTDDLPVSRGHFSPPVKCEESDQLDESFLHQVGLLSFLLLPGGQQRCSDPRHGVRRPASVLPRAGGEDLPAARQHRQTDM
ncbi:interleukin-1 receptor-associated kinase 3-like isoform X2 [Gadus macrocephalus]|uniref:interleukin-1 receptor-associated kinase 3-like isoform X2 n=1 Tax=Gadus macrocephalus TaxID=80720 RepID=UPI0028CB9D29|nr:interleukin-1 receptor-associated kinase 3-like isoform X2 [Gadus macrocephalus]